jgi:hypothetical protein
MGQWCEEQSGVEFRDALKRGHMYRYVGKALVLLASVCGVSTLSAQDISQYTDFTVFGKAVQVHGFVSEGFVDTNDNNWLTMNTSQGSFAMTDGGVNISTQLTDKLRVGAQVYDRNVGQLGKWHPELDWAVADYRFADWFGIRGGKVKTTLGLYNDTQDQDFLRVFALLPQSIYPTDLRDSTIAHTGGDVYGNIGLKKAGSLQYTLFAGQRQDSMYGGYIYLLSDIITFKSYGGLQYGADLRWNTPLKGLLVGVSEMKENITGTGTTPNWFGPGIIAYEEHSKDDETHQFYAQYTLGNLVVDSEFRRYWRNQEIFSGMMNVTTDTKGWYTAAAYRFSKRIAAGAYYSHFTDLYFNPMAASPTNTSGPGNHLYDKVVTLRYDLSNNWYVKVEEHFMDGYGSPGMYPDGFYTMDNPQGLVPNTIATVIRTGWNF